MTESNFTQQTIRPEPGLLETSVNIFTSPTEAFRALQKTPKKLFPLLLVLVFNALVLTWYFSIVDYSWFVDDILSAQSFSEEERVDAREGMMALSINTFAMFGVLGGSAAIIAINLLQAAYLSLVAALRGDEYKFPHWFSLACWAGLPMLLTIAGSVVTILLSPNGQLSPYDLDPLTLRNLGVVSTNTSVQALAQSLSLSTFWGIGLMVFGYKQWIQTSWLRAAITVLSPYLCVVGIWAVIAFS
ncbi:MAG: hypothetical protein ACJAY7_000701 [Pseudohongiellaceae bacterium]|jgi:hypothetical protein